MTINEEVLKELTAMKNVGMKVSNKLIKSIPSKDLSDYSNMSVSELADLLVDLDF